MTEVVLLGQTVNSYHDGEFDFADLLRAVGAGARASSAFASRARIRTTSRDRVIARDRRRWTRCASTCICRCSRDRTRVLKRMLRRYTREGYLECVAKLRAAIPGLSLTTDVIVGFPGETDEDFEETLAVVREVGFADGFTFKFSPRDGTPATRMPPELTVSRRSRERAARASRRDDSRRVARGEPRPARQALRGARREGSAARRRSGADAHARLQDRARSRRRERCSGSISRRAHGHDRLDVHGADRARAPAAADGRVADWHSLRCGRSDMRDATLMRSRRARGERTRDAARRLCARVRTSPASSPGFSDSLLLVRRCR